MNSTTSHVTPQFHVVFDDGFTTISYLNKKDVPAPINWTDLFHHYSECYEASDFEDLVTNQPNETTRKTKAFEGDIPTTLLSEGSESCTLILKVSEELNLLLYLQ